MSAIHKESCDGGRIKLAVIGEFQIGKSTLINGILGNLSAKSGNGWRPQTERHVDYDSLDNVVLIDTPGVNDATEREKDTCDVIKRATVIVYVRNNVQKGLGELDAKWLAIVKDAGRPCAFVLNCMPNAQDEDYGPDVENSWNPQSEFNIGRCGEIRRFVENDFKEVFLPIGEQGILPVNAHWALFGLDLLESPSAAIKVERAVRKLIGNADGTFSGADLRRWASAHSNVGIMHDFIKNIRLELLAHYLRHKDKLMTRISDRFCEEFSMRLLAKEVG